MISGFIELIYNHPLKVSNATRDINLNCLAISDSLQSMGIATDESEINFYLDKMKQHDAIIRNSFPVLSERFLGEEQLVSDAENSYNEWSFFKNEIIELKQAGRNDEVIQRLQNQRAYQIEDLFDKTRQLTEFASEKADEFYAVSLDKKNEAVRVLVIYTVLFLIICLGLAILLTVSISRPIKKFVDKIRHILGMPDEEIIFDVKSLSEADVLEATTAELEKAYERLTDFNIDLDKKVSERTTELEKSEQRLIEQIESYRKLYQEYKKQNIDLIQTKDRAEKSDMLKSAFLSNMSHEIRTPMNAIIGSAQLLELQGDDKEERNHCIEMINSSGGRLLRLISDILDLSKMDACQLSLRQLEFDLHACLQRIHKQFSISHHKEGVDLVLEVPKGTDSLQINSDEDRLTQIISNLLENAFKFTSSGHITFGYSVNENRLVFSVGDSGVGISEESCTIIFDRFCQGDIIGEAIEQGTGLGLSIVAGLVDLLGGEISVHSQLGKGSTFTFWIPLNQEEVLIGPTSEEKTLDSSFDGLGIKILIVDDEPSNVYVLEKFINHYDYSSITASNGKECVETFRKNPDIKLILMDIKMPVMNGYEAVKLIREIDNKVRIIALTAYAMADDRDKALNSGFDDYLAKPIKQEELIALIEKHIHHGLHSVFN